MSTATKLVAIAVVWIVAAVVLFGTGMHVGRTNSYDRCELVYFELELVRLCHTGAYLDEPPANARPVERA